jgi:hypothetical protein
MSILHWHVVSEFWDFGHALFRSNQETFPVPFIGGDVFDDAYISEQPVLHTGSSPSGPRPMDLHALKSLKELHGHVSALYAGSFFHLFDEAGQKRIARRLASLLSPEPGSMLIGVHHGMPEHGILQLDPTYQMFCYSPHSWKEMWENVFAGTKVEVRVGLKAHGGKDYYGTWPKNTRELFMMWWSITRV